MTVYLDQKRRDYADLSGKVQQPAAGFPLLVLGIEKLQEGDEIPMAVLETAMRWGTWHLPGGIDYAAPQTPACRQPLRKFSMVWSEIASVVVSADRASFLQAIAMHVPERLRAV